MVLGDFGKPYPSNALANLMAEPAERDEKEYHEAVGRLILSYGGAENVVHQLLRQLSGVSDKKARILFSKLRIGGVTTKIKELLPGSRKGKKAKEDILECLKQFDVIGKERDKIAHRETDIKGDALFVANKVTAKNILNVEQAWRYKSPQPQNDPIPNRQSIVEALARPHQSSRR